MGMPDLEQIRKNLPAHYDECRKTLGRMQYMCTCTATADVEALLNLVAEQQSTIDDYSATLRDLVGPDGGT